LVLIVGHDVHVVDIDLPGTMTSYNISRVPLTPGILFYCNVVGHSLSGIHSTETSDGIMVDTVSPTSGTVFDGIGYYFIMALLSYFSHYIIIHVKSLKFK
jgi:hypothetical protein